MLLLVVIPQSRFYLFMYIYKRVTLKLLFLPQTFVANPCGFTVTKAPMALFKAHSLYAYMMSNSLVNVGLKEIEDGILC